MYLPIGTIQTAKVLRKIETGYVLIKETDEVLMHHNDAVEKLKPNQEVDVFLYQDKENLIIATTKLPKILMDTYGWAQVVEVIPDLGAFVHIGIAKDILVSVDDLPLFTSVWPEVGDVLYVTLGKDQEDRLLALPATEGVFERIREDAPKELFNQPFTGRVYLTKQEGAAIYSKEGIRGFIHHTERDEEPRLGQVVTGRVIAVKDDGTVNVSLRPLKQDRIADDALAILELLELNNGVLALTSKSDPAEIKRAFNFSKSAFKRALGGLLKERKIELRDDKVYLVTDEDEEQEEV